MFRAPDNTDVTGHAYVVWAQCEAGGTLKLRLDDDTNTKAAARLGRELLEAHRLIQQLAGTPGSTFKRASDAGAGPRRSGPDTARYTYKVATQSHPGTMVEVADLPGNTTLADPYRRATGDAAPVWCPGSSTAGTPRPRVRLSRPTPSPLPLLYMYIY